MGIKCFFLGHRWSKSDFIISCVDCKRPLFRPKRRAADC